jgi:hypothetical protein
LLFFVSPEENPSTPQPDPEESHRGAKETHFLWRYKIVFALPTPRGQHRSHKDAIYPSTKLSKIKLLNSQARRRRFAH